MLTELAIGDAYGGAFEYSSRDFVEINNCGTRYYKHPTHETPAGFYTDDTQMSLAIAEALVSQEDWTPENLAERFVAVFKRDPRTGYAQGFYRFLTQVTDGEEFLRLIQPHSDKSGAAMRAAPIGVIANTNEVKRYATTQARLTHDTPDGIAAAVAAALMSHYCLYDLGSKRDLPAFLNRHVPGYNWDDPWRGKVRSKGWMSVCAAVTALVDCDSLEELLRTCIAFTGDVDTVATIALAAAAHSREYTHDLSQTLYRDLEPTLYGKYYLSDLDTRLLALVKSR